MCRVCRTCLEVMQEGMGYTTIDSVKPDSDSTCTKLQLEACIPEITLDTVKDCIICDRCASALSTAYEFRTRCLQTEERINSFMRQTQADRSSINLQQVVEYHLSLGAAETASQPGFEQCHTTGAPTDLVTVKTEEPLKLKREDQESDSDEQSDVDINSVGYKIRFSDLFKCSVCQRHEANMKRLMKTYTVQGTYYVCHPGSCDDAMLKMERHDKTTGDEKRFKCGICGYSSNKSLILHMKLHTEKRLLKCDDCDFSTVYKKHFNMHMNQTHTGVKSFQCFDCDYRSATKSGLAQHMSIRTGLKPFKCTLCEFSTAYQNNLRVHESIHARYMSYKGARCEFSRTTKRYLTKHIKNYAGDKPYKCNVCGCGTIYQSSLKMHSSVHGELKLYKCPECNYSTTSNASLNQHYAYIHPESRLFSCVKCKYSTALKEDYEKHMKLCDLATDVSSEECV